MGVPLRVMARNKGHIVMAKVDSKVKTDFFVGFSPTNAYRKINRCSLISSIKPVILFTRLDSYPRTSALLNRHDPSEAAVQRRTWLSHSRRHPRQQILGSDCHPLSNPANAEPEGA